MGALRLGLKCRVWSSVRLVGSEFSVKKSLPTKRKLLVNGGAVGKVFPIALQLKDLAALCLRALV